MIFNLYSRYSLLLCVLYFSGCNAAKNTPTIPKPKMVFVEGGTFTMGDVIDSSNTDALPLHEVTVNDYYIGETEVTYDQYDAFAKATKRNLPNDRNYGRGNRAVVYVTWYDAQAYCEYFGWRLPSEAEWEFAARNRGQKIKYAGTNNPDSLKKYAIIPDSNIKFAFNVASRKPNDLGLFDMSGNVFEYVGKFYQEYQSPEKSYPLETNAVRIIRGGSFKKYSGASQTYWRVGTYDSMIHDDVGFRCAVGQNELNKQRFLKGFFHRKPATP